MSKGSKILFIEDQTNRDNQVINVLETAGLLDSKMNIESREDLNDKTEGAIAISTSFKDSIVRIKELAKRKGEEYEWIFIDRDLSKYHDVKKALEENIPIEIDKKEYNDNFFKGYQYGEKEGVILVGDYLFIMLINSGVPIEKICFLTSNDDSSIESLRKSPYLHKGKLPQIIEKNAEETETLTEILKDSLNAKIRYLYRDIFDNQKIKQVIDVGMIEQFIELLAKIEKNEDIFTEQGIVLRNMLEVLVPEILSGCDGVRNFLNHPANMYNNSYYDCCSILSVRRRYCNGRTFTDLTNVDLRSFWYETNANLVQLYYKFSPEIKLEGYFKNKGWDQNDAGQIVNAIVNLQKDYEAISEKWRKCCTYLNRFPIENDRSNLENYYKKNLSPSDAKKQVDEILKLSKVNFLIFFMQHVFATKSVTISNLPPKYIFSYIDNIYTVTSEWSAHGQNQMTKNELSTDGWKALVYGMVQILQWFADDHPNAQ